MKACLPISNLRLSSPVRLRIPKALAFPVEDLDRFMEGLSAIDAPKRGCILVQFPASFKFLQWKLFLTLTEALCALNEPQGWHIAVEFRDTSWYRDQTSLFLKNHGISIVVHDKAGGAFSVDDTIADHVYVRFHGPEGDYKGSYEEAFLHEYATYIDAWLDLGKKVFVYFNNTMGNALSNMKTLRNEIKRS